MELLFLGTSAGVPTRTRNVTSILLDLQHPTRGGLWMFDCGEGTQHQLLQTASWIKSSLPTCMAITFLVYRGCCAVAQWRAIFTH